MMSMKFLFSRARRGLVGAGLLLLVALAVACGGGGGNGDSGNNDNNDNGNGGGNLDAFSNLPASPVVAAAAGVGDAALVITVAGATLQPFARSGFRSDGGEMATISLASDPVDIFTFDNAVVSLTITLSDSTADDCGDGSVCVRAARDYRRFVADTCCGVDRGRRRDDIGGGRGGDFDLAQRHNGG